MTEISTNAILVRHVKRPAWGVGILTFEDDSRRRYHFKDGESRTFKRGFYQLLERVDPPADEAARLVAELEEAAGVAEARRNVRAEARAAGVELMSFGEQVQAFHLLFPDAFQDAKWVTDVRGEGRSRARKQDRQPAIDMAQERLSEEALAGFISAGDFDGAFAALQELLSRTSLVSPSKDVAPLQTLDPADRPQVVEALYALLWSDGDLAERFDKWLKALSRGPDKPGWRLLTTPLMLVHPREHVVVHPTAFRQQAKWFSPHDAWKPTPSAAQYTDMVSLAQRVGAQLVQKQLAPRDLVDVYEFITRTLRPAAKKLLADQRGLKRG